MNWAGMKGEVTLADKVPWHLVLPRGGKENKADLTCSGEFMEVDVERGAHIVW